MASGEKRKGQVENREWKIESSRLTARGMQLEIQEFQIQRSRCASGWGIGKAFDLR